jgi:hypothetical protein
VRLPRPLSLRAALALGLTATTVLLAPVALGADDVVGAATTYRDANRVLGGQFQLWTPQYTAGLTMKRDIDVLAYSDKASAARAARATFVGSTYGRRVPSFTLAQKGAASNWAAKPVQHSSERLVDTVPIRIGTPGSKRVVRARIYANCDSGEMAPRSQQRCERRDVAQFGGAVVILARAVADGTPQATDIRIDSTGLTYQQLLRVARGLRPVD